MMGEEGCFLMADKGLNLTLSDRLKINARIKLYVGEDKNASWSPLDSIRGTGCVYLMESRLGGSGSSGVSGGGSWAVWVDLWRPLPAGLESLFERSTIEAAGEAVCNCCEVEDAMITFCWRLSS